MIFSATSGGKRASYASQNEALASNFIGIQSGFDTGIWELRFSVVKFLFRV